VPAPGFDPHHLFSALEAELPAYARPLFIRLCKGLAATATFKLQKQDLMRLGYEPQIGDVLIHDTAARSYVPLTPARLREINSGAARL
jgi:fatty-acyl-CoA synthase